MSFPSARQARPKSQLTSAHAGDKPTTIPEGKGKKIKKLPR